MGPSMTDGLNLPPTSLGPAPTGPQRSGQTTMKARRMPEARLQQHALRQTTCFEWLVPACETASRAVSLLSHPGKQETMHVVALKNATFLGKVTLSMDKLVLSGRTNWLNYIFDPPRPSEAEIGLDNCK
jgi:hypothetical protein